MVESNSDDSDDDGDGSYLHPSLFAPKKSSRLEELTKVLQMEYRPPRLYWSVTASASYLATVL